MRIAVICGSHPRNQMLSHALCSIPNVEMSAQIIMQRGELKPDPPTLLSADHKRLWNSHFEKRYEAETSFFHLDRTLPKNVPTKIVNNQKEMNSEDTVLFLNKYEIDVCFVSGVPIIRDPLFSSLPKYTINLHLGLIPDYKGAITMFWPFYMLEPTMAGCTYHFIDRLVDTGHIIHQSCPELQKGDGMHVVACKALITAIADLPLVINEVRTMLNNNARPISDPELERSGKLFKKSDFGVEKLRVIYDLYDDNIVDLVLGGEIISRNPQLIELKTRC